MEEQLSPLIPGGRPGRLLQNDRDHDGEDRESPEAWPSSPQLAGGKSNGWRPVSLTTPFLLGTMALSIGLAVVIETLAQISRKHGGLAFYASIDDIPTNTSFAYRYLPTIVATLYSFLWNWIDLDVKRVQPWIEVSKPGGMAAKSSLLVDYTTNFLPVAPIEAAKRRHWTVVFSGTAILLILWVLTPVQTSLFGVTIVQRNNSVAVTQRYQLSPVDEQLERTRPLTLLTTIERFNMTYPPFTASEYALLPFYLNNSIGASRTDRNWIAETTKMWAEADCSPVKVSDGVTYTNSNGSVAVNFTVSMFEDCSIRLSFDIDRLKPDEPGSPITNYPRLMSVEVYPLLHLDQDLWDCPRSPNNLYSALYYGVAPVDVSSKKTKAKLTALQCNLSFYKQDVHATVGSYTLRPIGNTEDLREQEKLGSEEFNRTSYLLSSAGFFSAVNETWEDTTVSGSHCVGFCAYVTRGRGYNLTDVDSVSKLSGLKELAKSYHQSLFSMTVSDRLTKQENPARGQATSVEFQTSIIISRAFSIISEVLLLLAAFSLGLIYYFATSSACLLARTPSSIADLIDIANNSPEMVKLLEVMDTANEKLLVDTLGATGFQMTLDRLSMSNKLDVKQAGTEQFDELYHTKRSKSYYKPVKPWILRRPTGGALVTVLIAGIAILSYLKAIERKEHGLQRPSESFEVLQLLENYIPTLFATGIEPFWILLTRTMCVFQPFKDLWKGHSRAARSVEATHTSVPPQLALFKAIASRHFGLSLLCLATLFANVLAIGLSALFIERPVLIQRPSPLDSRDQHRLFSSKAEESLGATVSDIFMDMIWANKTYNSGLSPWISTEFSFQPVRLLNGNQTQSENEYTLRTRGFGAEVNCTTTPVWTHRLLPFTEEDMKGFDGWDGCTDVGEKLLRFVDVFAAQSELRSTEPASLSYIGWPPDTVRSGLCPPLLYFVWAKAPNGTRNNATISGSHAICQPFLQTAMFDVTVDRNGYVVRYRNVTDFQTRLADRVSNNRTSLLIGELNMKIGRTAEDSWRNTSVTPDWMSHFISLDIASNDFLDPKTDAPDPSSLIPSIKKAYRQLFAAFLGLNTDLLEKQEATISVEYRIFMDDLAFIMAMVVLALDLVIALVFYLPETLYILPRPPSSVLSIMAYIAPSRAVRDGPPPSGWKNQTFSFGRYLGYDGKGHVGIERDPHVQVKDTSLGEYKPLFNVMSHQGR